MWKKLLLLGASIVLMMLLTEALLALFFPQRTLNYISERSLAISAPDDLLPYRLRPNVVRRHFGPEFDTTVRTNSAGYRNAEFETRKNGQFRVLAVGDSFTFGFGVEGEEAYPARLQARIQASCPGREIEVINAGFAACQYPDTYYLYLKERGLALDEDLVIVGFFIGNDIDHERVAENVWTKIGPEGLPERIEQPQVQFEGDQRVSKSVPPRYRYPILRNSHLVQGLVALKSLLTQPPPRAYLNGYMYRTEYLPRTVERVEMVERLFKEMKKLTDARGVGFLVLMIPTREQVYPDEFPWDDPPYSGAVDLEKPQRIFGEFFAANGIDYVDPLPDLREAASRQPLYFLEDQHLTPAAHELVGRVLAESQVVSSAWRAWCGNAGLAEVGSGR